MKKLFIIVLFICLLCSCYNHTNYSTDKDKTNKETGYVETVCIDDVQYIEFSTHNSTGFCPLFKKDGKPKTCTNGVKDVD